ncbi:MAG: DUF4331 family protein [Myxococcota bacterium]
MKKRWTLMALAACLAPAMVQAADHLDYPGASGDPTTDITDVFAWTDTAASNVNLVMNVAPFATDGSAFGTAAQYVFHVGNTDAFGGATDERTVLCQFWSATGIECWVQGADGSVLAYVEGNPSDPAGITSDDGGVRVFAGARNDPFFFEFNGFNNTRAAVLDAAGALTFDDAGCPALDEATSMALVGLLTSDDTMGAPVSDDFAGSNVLSLVLQIDRDLLTRDGNDVLAIWGSTNRGL